MKKGVVRFFDGKSINFSRKTERIFQKLEFFTWGLRLGRQPRGSARLSTPLQIRNLKKRFVAFSFTPTTSFNSFE